MAKSRIKSEEEYNEILGVAPQSNEQKEAVFNDANQYFEKLNEEKQTPADSNPFNKVISVEEIKENLKNTGTYNVESIKAQIASAQKEIQNEEDDNLDGFVGGAKHSSEKKEFSFEENARKLYENLRVSNINVHSKKAESNEVDEKAARAKEIEVVEPISISKERVANIDNVKREVEVEPQLNNEIPNTSSLQEGLNSVRPSAPIESVDSLELTADFTMENEDFIEAINQRQNSKPQPSAEPIVKIPREEVVPEVKESIPLVDNNADDLVKQLDAQMSYLEDSPVETEPIIPQQPIVEEVQAMGQPPIMEQPVVEQPAQPIIEPQPVVQEAEKKPEMPLNQQPQAVDNNQMAMELEKLTKPQQKSSLTDTVSLALDRESSISFSPDDMQTLQSEELLTDKQKPKSKVGETIITIALVIMILVVLFLLVKTFI
ncbi:hypothetical protein LJB88_04930, partial [Erysipelotrichaceae bacterium OttesenSCG-928-M19]|nr:hypothetical protein [Erysipelotrichaceae bacterium OttesenSCG-928-M19]